MLTWKDYFKRNGGILLLWRYFNAGVLKTALCQFVLLGKSRKALELLRLIVDMKIQQKLRRNYAKELNEAVNSDNPKQEHRTSRYIWICWWQGLEQAPPLVHCCYNSVCRHFSDWEIVIISLENYQKYVSFPSYIIEKWKAGKISLTHMSDLLRLELLLRYGGLWMDATVYCTGSNVPKSVFESDLFVYQTLKPGADGHCLLSSSWLIYAQTNNRLLKITQTLLYVYWKEKNEIIDYFILHHFFSLACEACPELCRRIPQICNSTPHVLLLNLFEPFDSTFMNDLSNMTCFHKLSYKLDENKMKETEGTYWEWIIKN